MSARWQYLIGDDADAAVRWAAERCVAVLSSVASERPGDLAVALSGGSTPAALFGLLAQPAYGRRIDVARVRWFWGDERTVPPDHADSNYRMARDALLRPLSVAADRIHRMPADAADLDAAARAYETLIRTHVPADVAGVPAFDLLLLGLGLDGHTASLFPHSPGLDERDRLVIAHDIGQGRGRRMTFTWPLLWSARQVLILATGTAKAEAVACVHAADADARLYPAADLKHARGQVAWCLDRPAAGLIESAIDGPM